MKTTNLSMLYVTTDMNVSVDRSVKFKRLNIIRRTNENVHFLDSRQCVLKSQPRGTSLSPRRISPVTRYGQLVLLH